MNLRASVAVVAAVALSVSVPTVSTAAPAADRLDSFTRAPSSGRLSATVTPRAVQSTKSVDVIVQLSGDPVAVAEAEAGTTFDTAKRDQLKAKLRTAQNTLGKQITAKGGTVTYQMQSAYNGMRVRIAASKVTALSDLPGVTAVHTLTPKSLTNTESVPFIGADTAWASYGVTGRGVKVAVIDSGIDYTHADFGGPGTPEAFAAASATSTAAADPALFGRNAPRVKGGYDFVGDAYDASSDDPAKNTPKADPNPLDCDGHGTHVAGTAAGSGVTTDGKTYLGPYDKKTESKSFKVGPGVAPQADLYALRVIGCSGSTDVVAEAIDWAVDHRMDVINMSLGGPFGRSDDPDATAASNAVAAGVVVVASAGNAGSSPYLVGSPSTGHGVVSVAAVDSIGTFPGASLKAADGTSLKAINANNADLVGGGLTVVPLVDDPETAENEALGCSVDAYTKAGIVSGGNQLAVVTRGTCARAAKPIFGQQAGAAAVLMVNTDEDYPPFEGPITSNPDDQTDFEVTIPFLGVRSTDADAITGLVGTTLTMAAIKLDNPNFRDYADFSSSGPVTGDSGLSPNVAAPGVSISSAGIGTGTGSAIESGTSMASPHVAGVAALAVQAHPGWKASQIASALVATSDPDKLMHGANSISRGGAGLVDPAGLVGTKAFVTGDSYRDAAGPVWQDSLSFGFDEFSGVFAGTKSITITNTASTPVTYTLSNDADDNSRPGWLRFSTSRVKVPARGTAKVKVSLYAQASTVGSSVADSDDQFNFYEVSGQVRLTGSDGSTLRVPYLLVPRASSKLVAKAVPGSGAALNSAKGPAGTLNVRLSNFGGALDAPADFYTLGLTDKPDVSRRWGGSGYDLRAAGAQSWDADDEGTKVVVFGVNTWSRWSNAAADEFDVLVDVNGDQKADYIVFSADSGAVRTGDFNGISEVFVSNLKTGALAASGFLAQAPTDSSTILLPVMAADLGLSEAAGGFSYTVNSYTVEDADASDSFTGWATYNPWSKAVEDGDYELVPVNRMLTVPVTLNAANVATQKPQGVMVVGIDNASGANEAQLLPLR